MPQNLRAIRRKVKAVQSIAKITRAMKMVAAAKLRRVQDQVENGRIYWDHLEDLITHVAAQADDLDHPFFEAREVASSAVLIIGGSRGLCGGFNTSLSRYAEQLLGALRHPAHIMTVGPKIFQYLTGRGYEITQYFELPAEDGRLEFATHLGRHLREMFLAGEVDEVRIVGTEFFSAIRHIPLSRKLLPVDPPQAGDNGENGASYLFEPKAETLLANLMPRAMDAAIFRMLLESNASEEGARMTAMTAATDNADEMIETLSRELNRARQTQITTEILEVVSGAEALTSG